MDVLSPAERQVLAEQQRVAQLESTRQATELVINEIAEKAAALEAELKTLKGIEADQLERIKHAETERNRLQLEVAARADREVKLQAELNALYLAASRHHLSKSQLVQAEADAKRLAETNRVGVEDQSLREAEQLSAKEFEDQQAQIRAEIFATEIGETEPVLSEPDPIIIVHEVVASVRVQQSAPVVDSWEASQGIDLVRQEKGMDVVDEKGSVPAAILERIRHVDAAERTAGLFELSQFAGDESFNLICKAFDDPVLDVRNSAAHALFQMDRDHATTFTRALSDGTPERRRRIGSAMAASGIANDAIDDLIGEGREKTYDAFSILFLMAKAGEIQPLVRAIETHQDMSVRLAVISLLAFSNQPETIPAFRRLAVRASLPAEIRSALMEAIHQISTQGRQQSVA